MHSAHRLVRNKATVGFAELCAVPTHTDRDSGSREEEEEERASSLGNALLSLSKSALPNDILAGGRAAKLA